MWGSLIGFIGWQYMKNPQIVFQKYLNPFGAAICVVPPLSILGMYIKNQRNANE